MGFMTPETFIKCLQYIDPASQHDINNHPVITGFGETFIHPNYDGLFTIAKNMDIYLRLHTNGLKLTRKDLEKLPDYNISQLEISIHTEQSLAAFKLAYETIIPNNPNFPLYANIMSCHAPKLQGWINSVGISADALHRVKMINMHNWAMNEREHTEEENKKWQDKCLFLKYYMAVIRWDGNVYTCCVDSEGVNYMGHIDNLKDLTIEKEKYKLCSKCSPAWFNGEIGGYELNVIEK